MTIAISVTGDALLGYAVTVTDADQGDRVRVFRRDVSGHYADSNVRELDFAAPTGSTMIVIDYEAPFNTELIYTAEAYDLGDLETPIGTDSTSPLDTVLPVGFAIITDPLNANLRIAVAVSELSSWSYDTRILGHHQVIGRSNSIQINDVESGRTGSMVVSNLEQFGIDWDDTGPYLPYTVVAHANWRTIFSSGRTLLFRNTWYESGFEDLYFKISKRNVSRVGNVSQQGSQPWLSQSIDFIEQDRPSTSITGLAIGTWQVVRDSNVNWTEVNSDHATWGDVLLSPSL